MGWKYEVEAWVVIATVHNLGREHQQYGYVTCYAGNSLIKALWEFRKAKKYSGCVKIEVR